MINTLNEINKMALERPEEFIKICNEKYSNHIADIAKRISEDDRIKIVAIAGPSGSGKTTTAHIFQEQLKRLGETVAVVSLDDFYLPADRLPILPDGSVDIESVNSLDVELINECFDGIIKYGKTVLPHYDFKTRAREKNAKQLDIGNHGIVIVEGLHALNPLIADDSLRKNIFKIYISVNRSVDDNNGVQMLSSRQIRLIRRVLRDDKFRGATATETLHLWNNVIDGERKYLYCFKDTADVQLVTFHPYELGVYRERFGKMRNTVNKNAPCYDYFIKTANALERFSAIDSTLVPENSLIREFIGGLKL
ncbi:MAG: nucleoside kinase [Clostridia bacterium]|nr:nucleoside kinase [Clostridia bacterium]